MEYFYFSKLKLFFSFPNLCEKHSKRLFYHFLSLFSPSSGRKTEKLNWACWASTTLSSHFPMLLWAQIYPGLATKWPVNMGKRDTKTEHHDAFSNFSVFSCFYCLFCFKNTFKALLNDQNNPSLNKPPLSECLFFRHLIRHVFQHHPRGFRIASGRGRLGPWGAWCLGSRDVPIPLLPPLCFSFQSGLERAQL